MLSSEVSYIPGMGMRIETEGKPIELYRIKHGQELPGELPKGYCFFGGAARSIALRHFGENTLPPRDIDVVGISDFGCDELPTLRDELSRRFMEEDYRHGHGVEIDSLARYFTTRDFTINQLLVMGDTLYITRDAATDLRRRIVRPSINSYDSWANSYEERSEIHPKLVVRAIRLAEEFNEMYGQGKIAGINKWQFEAQSIPVFWIALGLDRAYQRGESMAMRFYLALLKYGIISERENNDGSAKVVADSPESLALEVRFQMFQEGREPFEFSRRDLNGDTAADDALGPIYRKYRHYADLANSYVGKGNRDLPEY